MKFSEELQDQIDTLYDQSTVQIDRINSDSHASIMLATTLGAAVGIISVLIPKQHELAQNFRADIMATLPSSGPIDSEECMDLQDRIFSVIQTNHRYS